MSEVSFLMSGLSGSSGVWTPVCARAKSLMLAQVSLTDSTNLCFKFAPILDKFSRSSEKNDSMNSECNSKIGLYEIRLHVCVRTSVVSDTSAS